MTNDDTTTQIAQRPLDERLQAIGANDLDMMRAEPLGEGFDNSFDNNLQSRHVFDNAFDNGFDNGFSSQPS